MSFTQKTKENVMVACGRCCSICHTFCGNNMEVHHIKQHADGGEDTFENAIPLCFNCHAEVGQYNTHHPKGIKLTESELLQHRDNWYEKIKNNGGLISNSKTKKLDIETYYKLKNYLPTDLMSFIKDIEFGSWDFELDKFKSIEEFVDICANPILEYLDNDLEVAKVMLKNSIMKFSKDSVPYIYCDDGKLCRIPRDWEYNNPKGYANGVELLNQDTIEIWNRYCEYIKLCRRKLEIQGD